MSLLSECDAEGIVTLTLNDPARRNPLGNAVRMELSQALLDAESDKAVRGVVLTGAGGQFSAGGDIRDQRERSIAEHRARFSVVRDLVLRIVRFSKPLVGAVEGWAAGGGFSLAVACSTLVASRKAKFTASFTKIGLIPDMGLLATLPARTGPSKARQIILSNRRIEAEEALVLGIVDELAEPGSAADAARKIARAQAAEAPLPRQLVTDWFARGIDEALDFERSVQPALLNGADAAEGRAAFRAKRVPEFKGR